MVPRFLSATLALGLTACLSLPGDLPAEDQKSAQSSDSSRVVRIGSVGGNSPRARTAFTTLTAYLNQQGFPSEFILYRNYDAMNEALKAGKIDIAWNSPLAHAKFHLDSQCRSQTLAMREGDRGLHVLLVAPQDAGIRSLKDLRKRRVIVGRQHYQEGMLSVHLLKKAGVDLQQVELVRLPARDKDGKRADTAGHILRALAAGRGDAAVVPLGHWRRAKQWRSEHKDVSVVWKSPEFNHCVFTACEDFDRSLGRRFTKLMTSMDLEDPLVARFNRMEGTRLWLPGDSEGFESLVDALREQRAKSKQPAGQSQDRK